MALRFFQKIAKTYRQENWFHLLYFILKQCAACATKSSDYQAYSESVTEMLDSRVTPDESLRKELLDTFLSQLSIIPLRTVLIDMTQLSSFISCFTHFETSESDIYQPVSFQIALQSKNSLPFVPSKLVILFNDSQFDQCFIHSPGSSFLKYKKDGVWMNASQASWGIVQGLMVTLGTFGLKRLIYQFILTSLKLYKHPSHLLCPKICIFAWSL